MLFTLFLLGGSALAARKNSTVAYVLEGKNQVFIDRGRKVLEAHKGSALENGDRVRTEKGNCLLRMVAYPAKVRLSARSQGEFLAAPDPDMPPFRFLVGRAWVQKRPGDPALLLSVDGATLRADDAEIFIDEVAGGVVRVAVRTGEIRLERHGDALVLGAMSEVSFRPETAPVVRGITADDILAWNEPFERY